MFDADDGLYILCDMALETLFIMNAYILLLSECADTAFLRGWNIKTSPPAYLMKKLTQTLFTV